jgi:N-acyl-D-amino-acid deacylase
VTSRREFLGRVAGALAVIGCAPQVRLPGSRRYDLLIRGGTVFDGTGSEGMRRDIGILDGRIVAIGATLTERARNVIDAQGLAVAPGFIDIHSHGDGSMFEDPRSESVIRQGVTTIVCGQDGSSWAPRRPTTDRDTQIRRSYDVEPDFDSLGEFFGAVERLPPSMNVASMVGLGTVRGVVIGNQDRPATPGELHSMRSLVEGALAQGACGASSGLEYTPNAFASIAEEIELCRPLAARRLPYATHMRNEADTLLEAIDEAIAVARGAGCPLQISHLKTQGPRNFPKIDAAFARIEAVKREGLDIAFDRYPWIAYSTGLTSLFPVWSRDGGTAAFLKRLGDPAVAERIKRETLAKVEMNGGWHSVMITSVRAPADKAVEGKHMDDFAREIGADPYQVTTALLARSNGSVGMAGFAMSEENVDRFLAHPLGMVCSDGGAFATEGPTRRGSPHPRGIGSFPRVLGRYVRERKALTLPQAIHKMTAFPASRIRLTDRGQLKEGFAADVVVFDPATVRDRGDFSNPFQYPEGIRVVIVNGEVSLRDGERSERRSGKVLRA